MELFIDDGQFISPHFVVPTPSDFVPTHCIVAEMELLGATLRDGKVVAEGKSLNPLEFARWGLLAVRQTGAFGHSHISDDEGPMRLLMRLDGDNVLLHWTGTRRTARLPYKRLLETWQAFDARIRTLTLRLTSEFPLPMPVDPARMPRLSGVPRQRRRFPIPDLSVRREHAPRYGLREAARWRRWLRGESEPLVPPVPNELLALQDNEHDRWSHVDAEEAD